MDVLAWAQALSILGMTASQVSADDQSIIAQASTSDDPWLIAAELADLFAMRAMATGRITKFTADGATFERSQADWVSLAAALRVKAGEAGADGFAFVVAPATPPRRPEPTGAGQWPPS